MATDTSGVKRVLPAAAAGANNGTTPPAPVMAVDSSDDRGSVTFGSGSAPAAGAQLVVSFAVAKDPARLPVIQITETTTATAALNPAVTSTTSAGFTVSTGAAPAASQGNTIYGLSWAAQD
jgi:hypothetical protein